jgi:hypothetical protein
MKIKCPLDFRGWIKKTKTKNSKAQLRSAQVSSGQLRASFSGLKFCLIHEASI